MSTRLLPPPHLSKRKIPGNVFGHHCPCYRRLAQSLLPAPIIRLQEIQVQSGRQSRQFPSRQRKPQKSSVFSLTPPRPEAQEFLSIHQNPPTQLLSPSAQHFRPSYSQNLTELVFLIYSTFLRVSPSFNVRHLPTFSLSQPSPSPNVLLSQRSPSSNVLLEQYFLSKTRISLLHLRSIKPRFPRFVSHL